MRTLALVLNLALLLFVVFLLVAEGIPTDLPSIGLSLLVLIVPLQTAIVIGNSGLARNPGARMAVATANVVLIAAAGWAVATRLPSHPPEEGLIPFVVLLLAAPLVSLVALRLPSARVA